jgi:4-carboxymuconolactone decarboxylase
MSESTPVRYPPLKPEEMTQRQRDVAAAIARRRADAFSGPLVPLIYSPEVADRIQLLGEHLRFDLRIPERLRVLAVLVAAGRYRSGDVAHFVHLDAIKQSGLGTAKITALSQGRRPEDMKEDEEMVYDYCTELTTMGRLRSATFERMVNRFGREICLELVEVCGYTLLLTTLVNVTQVQLADPRV